jgi:hypothetical protein
MTSPQDQKMIDILKEEQEIIKQNKDKKQAGCCSECYSDCKTGCANMQVRTDYWCNLCLIKNYTGACEECNCIYGCWNPCCNKDFCCLISGFTILSPFHIIRSILCAPCWICCGCKCSIQCLTGDKI